MDRLVQHVTLQINCLSIVLSKFPPLSPVTKIYIFFPCVLQIRESQIPNISELLLSKLSPVKFQISVSHPLSNAKSLSLLCEQEVRRPQNFMGATGLCRTPSAQGRGETWVARREANWNPFPLPRLLFTVFFKCIWDADTKDPKKPIWDYYGPHGNPRGLTIRNLPNHISADFEPLANLMPNHSAAAVPLELNKTPSIKASGHQICQSWFWCQIRPNLLRQILMVSPLVTNCHVECCNQRFSGTVRKSTSASGAIRFWCAFCILQTLRVPPPSTQFAHTMSKRKMHAFAIALPCPNFVAWRHRKSPDAEDDRNPIVCQFNKWTPQIDSFRSFAGFVISIFCLFRR